MTQPGCMHQCPICQSRWYCNRVPEGENTCGRPFSTEHDTGCLAAMYGYGNIPPYKPPVIVEKKQEQRKWWRFWE